MFRLEVHHYFHGSKDSEVINKLDALLLGQQASKTREVKMAKVVDDLVIAVEAQTGRVASLETYIVTANQLIRDALAGVVLPAEVETKLDAVLLGTEANTGRIAAALEANPLPGPPA